MVGPQVGVGRASAHTSGMRAFSTSSVITLTCCPPCALRHCHTRTHAQLPRSVSALACKGDLTFAAAGGVIHEAKRSHP
jgi:hypothetical protein